MSEPQEHKGNLPGAERQMNQSPRPEAPPDLGAGLQDSLEAVDNAIVQAIPNLRERIQLILEQKLNTDLNRDEQYNLQNEPWRKALTDLKIEIEERIEKAKAEIKKMFGVETVLATESQQTETTESLEPREQEFADLSHQLPIKDEGQIEFLLLLNNHKYQTEFIVEKSQAKKLSSLEPDLAKFGLALETFPLPGAKRYLGCNIYNKEYRDAESQRLLGGGTLVKENQGFKPKEVNAINRVTMRTAGLRYGFPETAIQAHVESSYPENKNQSDPILRNRLNGGLPPDVIKSPAFAFASFNLSKNHWQEELKTSEAWANEVKKLDPKLYRRKMRSHARVIEQALIKG